jgi:hypothetical protein
MDKELRNALDRAASSLDISTLAEVAVMDLRRVYDELTSQFGERTALTWA